MNYQSFSFLDINSSKIISKIEINLSQFLLNIFIRVYLKKPLKASITCVLCFSKTFSNTGLNFKCVQLCLPNIFHKDISICAK